MALTGKQIGIGAAGALGLVAVYQMGAGSGAPSGGRSGAEPALTRNAPASSASVPSAPDAPVPAPDNRFPLPYPRPAPATYSVGQDVELLYSGKWVPAKVVEVAIVNGEQVVRTTWPESTNALPYLVMNRANEVRLPTGRLGPDLAIGRYVCYDGGTDRSDLDFRVAEWGRYTDPYGENGGSFTAEGDTIRFSGGKLDGSVGQQFQNNEFFFTPQFKCRWQMEGM